MASVSLSPSLADCSLLCDYGNGTQSYGNNSAVSFPSLAIYLREREICDLISSASQAIDSLIAHLAFNASVTEGSSSKESYDLRCQTCNTTDYDCQICCSLPTYEDVLKCRSARTLTVVWAFGDDSGPQPPPSQSPPAFDIGVCQAYPVPVHSRCIETDNIIVPPDSNPWSANRHRRGTGHGAWMISRLEYSFTLLFEPQFVKPDVAADALSDLLTDSLSHWSDPNSAANASFPAFLAAWQALTDRPFDSNQIGVLQWNVSVNPTPTPPEKPSTFPAGGIAGIVVGVLLVLVVLGFVAHRKSPKRPCRVTPVQPSEDKEDDDAVYFDRKVSIASDDPATDPEDLVQVISNDETSTDGDVDDTRELITKRLSRPTSGSVALVPMSDDKIPRPKGSAI